MLNSACYTLSVSTHCPRRASMTAPGSARSEVICGLYLCTGCAHLWCSWEAVRGWQHCYQPGSTSQHNLHPSAVPTSSDQGHSRSFQLQEAQDGQQNSHAGRSPGLFSQYARCFSADEKISFLCMARIQFSASVGIFSSIS